MDIPTLISTSTASGASSVDITSGIDSTYDEYMFVMTDIGPATDGGGWEFQVNAAAASGFNETVTTTIFTSQQNEAGTVTELSYATGNDQAQGTAYIDLNSGGTGNDADSSAAGVLHLFSPASTTYVKHFYARTSFHHGSDYAMTSFLGGYINTTSAIDEISFKMHSGNFDGVIQMYGIA